MLLQYLVMGVLGSKICPHVELRESTAATTSERALTRGCPLPFTCGVLLPLLKGGKCGPRGQASAEAPDLQEYKTHERLRSGDQVIRENPASRGTEASAEVLVGPVKEFLLLLYFVK